MLGDFIEGNRNIRQGGKSSTRRRKDCCSVSTYPERMATNPGLATRWGNMTMFQSDMQVASNSTAARILANYSPRIVPRRVESLGNLGGFSGAGIWRVTTDQGDFALRLWPSPGLPATRILGLHRLLDHLRRGGTLTVAAPVAANTGSTLIFWGTRHWQLEPWMPGTADFRANPSDARLRAAMAALAQWHHCAARYIPTASDVEWFRTENDCSSPAVTDRIAVLQQAGDCDFSRIEDAANRLAEVRLGSLLRQVIALFQMNQAAILRELIHNRTRQVRLQPCLRDVWRDHLLFENDRVSAIIDPSACRTDTVACDLSRLLGSLVGDDLARWDLAVEEYHRCRPLSSAERMLIRVMDRSGVLLSGWTWIQWLCVDRRTFLDLESVVNRLTEIRDRMSRLAQPGRLI